MWKKIPKEIMDELALLRKHTRSTGNEASFTFCKRPHRERLYVGHATEGDPRGTEVGDCAKELGKGTRIGDAHSHPVVSDSVGITPSDADIFGVVEESRIAKHKQINCITSHLADIVHCMEPKEMPTRQQIRGYSQITDAPGEINPYIVDHVGQDFNIGLFDRNSGEILENPSPKRVVENAFGTSRKHLRRTIKEMHYGNFCDFIQDVNVPSDDRIHEVCKNELKKKGLLDYLIS